MRLRVYRLEYTNQLVRTSKNANQLVIVPLKITLTMVVNKRGMSAYIVMYLYGRLFSSSFKGKMLAAEKSSEVGDGPYNWCQIFVTNIFISYYSTWFAIYSSPLVLDLLALLSAIYWYIIHLSFITFDCMIRDPYTPILNQSVHNTSLAFASTINTYSSAVFSVE